MNECPKKKKKRNLLVFDKYLSDKMGKKNFFPFPVFFFSFILGKRDWICKINTPKLSFLFKRFLDQIRKQRKFLFVLFDEVNFHLIPNANAFYY